MADKTTRFLTGLGLGITNPKGNLGDARHAARLYTDYTYSRAPRTKFLYHVFFDIDEEAMRGSDWKFKHQVEAGMLVKSADLPKFTYDYELKNQYNKKKIVYKDIKYDPVTITLHDDNIGVINALAALYYGYYSPERFHGDLSKPTDRYQSSPTGVGYGPYDKKPLGGGFEETRYGLDADGVNSPLFKSITIYTMARKTFNAYTLVHPHITSMNHGQVNQSESNGTLELSMTLAYESVRYSSGAVVKSKEPKGFQFVHYDTVPSPLSLTGGAGTGQIFGPQGLIQSTGEVIFDATKIFQGYYSPGVTGGTGDLLSSAVRAVNFYKNLASISKESLAAEATGLLLSPQLTPGGAPSSLGGVTFPGLNKN